MAGSNHLVLVVPMHDYIRLYKLASSKGTLHCIKIISWDQYRKYISNFNIDSELNIETPRSLMMIIARLLTLLCKTNWIDDRSYA